MEALGRRLAQTLEQQRVLTNQLRPAQLAVHSAQEGILVTDTEGVVTDVNPAFERMTGYRREEVVGRSAGHLYRWVEDPSVQSQILEQLQLRGQWRGAAAFSRKSGERLDSLTSISNMLDENAQLVGRVVVFSDITELRRTQRLLEQSATTDALTGLPNASRFEVMLQAALAQAQAQQRRLAVFFVDIDHFKSINDTLGHEAGDEVLRQASRTMLSWLGDGAVVARRSGDEFLAFAWVEGSAQEFRSWVRSMHPGATLDVQATPALDQAPAAPTRLTVQCSVGVALYPDDASDVQALFRAADGALYAAKEQGRHCVEVYSERIGTQTQRRLLVHQRLEAALEQGALRLAYQPQTDMGSGRVVGFEALCRWRDAVLGEVAPSEFIAVAMDGDLILRLGQQVLHQALADLPALLLQHPQARVAVNFSLQELSHPEFFTHLAQSLHAAGPDAAQHLEIEITEHALTQVTPKLLAQLQDLRAQGCTVAIDDFGTGQSSLARLHQLPVDKIKLDRLFVQDLSTPGVAAIVRCVVELAAALGHSLVVEGVETQEEWQALQALGCRLVQGNWVAAPMGLEEVMKR